MLNIDEPAAYWDEVENLLKAINVVSPGRHTSRRVSAKSNVDQVEGGNRVQLSDNPPPLGPISTKPNSKSGSFKQPGN